jgi:glutaredoxin
LKVTLYSKKDCGLCHETERLLRVIQKSQGFEIEVVDIEGEEAAYRRYWERIPVVMVEGKEVAAAPIDEAHLRAALTA